MVKSPTNKIAVKLTARRHCHVRSKMSIGGEIFFGAFEGTSQTAIIGDCLQNCCTPTTNISQIKQVQSHDSYAANELTCRVCLEGSPFWSRASPQGQMKCAHTDMARGEGVGVPTALTLIDLPAEPQRWWALCGERRAGLASERETGTLYRTPAPEDCQVRRRLTHIFFFSPWSDREP